MKEGVQSASGAKIVPIGFSDGRAVTVVGHLQDHLHIGDWSFGTRKTIVGDLESELDNLPDEWEPHIIIFDWLGGALVEGVSYDHVRHIYMDGMNHLTRYAKNHNIVAIAFTQTRPSKRKEVLEEDIKECKSLHQFAERAGFSYKYYQAIEAGRKPDLRLSTLERLAGAYGLEVHELLSPRLPKSTNPPRQRSGNPKSE